MTRYSYDDLGRQKRVTYTNGTETVYAYDKLSRLTSESRYGIAALDEGYIYDSVGNRLGKTSLSGSQNYTYDANNRLLSDGKYTYAWDDAGRMTGRTGVEGTTTYTYDAEDRLIEVSGPEGWARFLTTRRGTGSGGRRRQGRRSG